MKSVLKKAILAALPLMMMAAIPVYADGRTVTYNGSTLEISSTEADRVTGLEPGDTAEFTVTFTNGSSKQTSWYLSNEVAESLLSSADDGGYEYVLSYTDASGSSHTLYDNSNVGGTGTEGLIEATEGRSIDDYFYLTDLAAGKSGTVTLKVTLDGESQPNTYMLSEGQLLLSFAVEEIEPQGETRTVKRVNRVTVPNTGDDGITGSPYFYTFMISFAALILLCVMYLKMTRRAVRK